MKQFIEIWNAKPAWHDLAKAKRAEYLTAIGPHMQEMMANGVEILSWGINENTTSQRAAFDYFAVWSFPNQEAVDAFEKLVEGAGWYNYFEQINLSGTAATPNEIIGKLIEL